MYDFFYSLDKAIFYFGNQTMSNPFFDWFMPILTDLNRTWWGLSLFGIAWLFLFFKCGKKGRVAALLLIPLIYLTDQVSSSVIKKIVERARPCHEINGIVVLENIRLLVHCGSGYAFPSSHAANNFAVAFLLTYFYRRWWWAFFLFAGLVAFSRIAVGVHYPSDILGGAALGGLCASLIIAFYQLATSRYPILSYSLPEDTPKELEVS